MKRPVGRIYIALFVIDVNHRDAVIILRCKIVFLWCAHFTGLVDMAELAIDCYN